MCLRFAALSGLVVTRAKPNERYRVTSICCASVMRAEERRLDEALLIVFD